MPCYHPRKAWYAKAANPKTGKHSVIYAKQSVIPPGADLSRPLKTTCRQCIGCRLAKSLEWAVRCEHERILHDEACFITLTYDNQHLPENGSLNHRDFQLFMKELRNHVSGRQKGGKALRYYMCGEYGEKRGRPHYHLILFGWAPKDLVEREKRRGVQYYESPTITKLWRRGGTRVGEANFQTAAYCARYITKKLNGKRAHEYGNKKPEYNQPSRRGGLGKGWMEKYYNDVYPKDSVRLQSGVYKPSKFYDGIYEIIDPERFAQVKEARIAKGESNEQSPLRLLQLKKIQTEKYKKLKRGYENGTTQ